MFNNYKLLAIIPARGGSKGIKDKNIIPLCGKPLIAYTIEAAKQSMYIDNILLSTDSSIISDCANLYGLDCPFIRPSEISQDTSKTIDVVLHVIDYLKNIGDYYDAIILLQPTQPLRTSQNIDEAIELFFKDGKNNLVSVCEVDDHPVLTRKINSDGLLVNILDASSTIRRQDMPSYYKVNGCIYINWTETLNFNTSFNDNLLPYYMPQYLSVDIDTMLDLEIAKYYLEKEGLK